MLQIRDRGGEYVVCVKGNQGALRDAVAEVEFVGCDMSASAGAGHGRVEERCVAVVENPDGLPSGWADVGAVVTVGREREVGGVNTSTAHFYLSSLRASAAELAGYIRNHWGIENTLHWSLDVSFREDDSRARAGHAGENLGTVRRVAPSLLKRTDTKGSIQTRRMKAAWDDNYMLTVIQGIGAK